MRLKQVLAFDERVHRALAMNYKNLNYEIETGETAPA